MPALEAAIEDNRAAITAMNQAAEAAAGVWKTPRAPGKWSPAQVTEHVIRTYEEAGKTVAGKASKFPKFPLLVRLLFRRVFFRGIIKKGKFGMKAKTFKHFDPNADSHSGPENPAAAKVKAQAALEGFEEACRARAAAGLAVETSTFATVSVEEYITFQAIHTRLHVEQMKVAPQ